MKEKNIKNKKHRSITLLDIIKAIIVIIISMFLIIIGYYLFAEIESTPISNIKETILIDEYTFSERKVFVVKSSDTDEYDKTIIYLHGGAYVQEITDNHWEFLEKIALDTNSKIIVPDYPLTPKYTYIDVFNMIRPLYEEIVNNEYVDTNNLILMGDSAGGGMALGLLESLSKDNIIQPSHTILISPWLDVTMSNTEISKVEKLDKQLNKEALKLAGIAYAGTDGMTSYLVNPINGELEGLNNITIITGTNDILNPDVWLLDEKAKNVNTQIDIVEYQDAGHIWMIENYGSEELIINGYNSIVDTIEK